MNKNQAILRAVGKLRAVWIILIVLQLLLAAVVYGLMGHYGESFGWKPGTMDLVRLVALGVIALALVIQSVYFLSRIQRTKVLARVDPLVCYVEDILVHSYIRSNQRQYHPYLLVKDRRSGKRYFAYGKYCLSFYNFSVAGMNHQLAKLKIFRKDGSAVVPGDRVFLYIRRPVDIQVTVDADNSLMLNGRKYRLQNAEGLCTSQTFAQVIFVEAAVDVEAS